jgi:hypothetical protein
MLLLGEPQSFGCTLGRFCEETGLLQIERYDASMHRLIVDDQDTPALSGDSFHTDSPAN